MIPLIKKYWPIEYMFVFLPYVIRTLFPTLFPRTSFRDSMKNQTGKFSFIDDMFAYYYS